MRIRFAVLVVLLSTLPVLVSRAESQILTRRDMIKKSGTTIASATEPPAKDLLSQATLAFDSEKADKPTLAVQAFDAYFGKYVALHFRATLTSASASPAPGESIYQKPNANLRSQLLDTYGGIVNATFSGERAGKLGETGNASGDFRIGMKLLETPVAKAEAATAESAYEMSGAFTSSANGRLGFLGKSSGDDVDLHLSGSAFLNVFVDAKLKDRFDTPLNRANAGFNAELSLSAPNQHFYVSAGFKWSNDKQIGHQWLFSFSPVR